MIDNNDVIENGGYLVRVIAMNFYRNLTTYTMFDKEHTSDISKYLDGFEYPDTVVPPQASSFGTLAIISFNKDL